MVLSVTIQIKPVITKQLYLEALLDTLGQGGL